MTRRKRKSEKCPLIVKTARPCLGTLACAMSLTFDCHRQRLRQNEPKSRRIINITHTARTTRVTKRCLRHGNHVPSERMGTVCDMKVESNALCEPRDEGGGDDRGNDVYNATLGDHWAPATRCRGCRHFRRWLPLHALLVGPLSGQVRTFGYAKSWHNHHHHYLSWAEWNQHFTLQSTSFVCAFQVCAMGRR